MITAELKSKVDRIWDAFRAGGISNPLEVIEQITYLLFIKELDETETRERKRAERSPSASVNLRFQPDQEDLRWSRLKDRAPETMYQIVAHQVFPYLQQLGSDGSAYSHNMRDARFTIPSPALLARVVEMIDQIPMADRDTKGDLYEYMISKIAMDGHYGQFRTSRHIIQLMVEMTAPTPSDQICDPACGTGGFLVEAGEHIRRVHPDVLHDVVQRKHFHESMFHGFDFDSTMLRIGSMNMLMHGVENPDIRYRDSLAESVGSESEKYSLILANPPFAGSIDYESTSKDLQRIVKTKKTELLFLALFLRLLKPGGRAAVIVPEGVLFGSSRAHKELRRMLVEDQRLDGVVKLPSSAFKPYSSISTAILLFTKTNSGGTDNVWFYEVTADGWSLNGKRTQLLPAEKLGAVPQVALTEDEHAKNSLPDALRRWFHRDTTELARERTEQSFCVPKPEIIEQGYDLSFNRYRMVVHEAAEAMEHGPGQYQVADTRNASTSDGQAGPHNLSDDLGFIRWDDSDRAFVGRLWDVFAESNQLTPQSRLFDIGEQAAQPPETSSPQFASTTPDSARTTDQGGPDNVRYRQTSVESGQLLEEATARLFAHFFSLSPENRGDLIGGIRQQSSGSQFGYDVKITCTVAGSSKVVCHVECKNFARSSRVALRDVADKLMQNKMHYRDAPFDHWILISPHADPSNELQLMLDHWNRVGEFPFNVQVWSPQTGIREFFSLEPSLYEALYGVAPPESVQSIVDIIRDRLAPRVRLAPVWQNYLRLPAQHCIGSERADHFADLMNNHVNVRATDVNGSVLDGTLLDRVLAWMDGPSSGNLLLLADFGEGKSFFTYMLSRRLCEDFLTDPNSGVIPLRIPLGRFKTVRDGRLLLKQRLDEIGATLAEWRDLTASNRCLAILDGFDEMSTSLSNEDIEENIAGLESCLAELTGPQLRIIVTSRGRVLDVGRNRARILDRLDQPHILHLSPVPRADRIRYLESFMNDPQDEQRLSALRALYDPVGLAAKPLFLQMIRETLADLPRNKFSELILYRTYVHKSLSRKLDYLRAGQVTNNELIENLLRILERIAVQLQTSDQPYVYLRDAGEADRRLAEMLWQTRDGVAQPASGDGIDATARVSIRSLLKAASAPEEPRWPVTFFHRSMQEYFVACALVRMLHEDREKARNVLDSLPPLPEIIHFTASMIRELPDTAAIWDLLESFTRSATVKLQTTYLGGHAITLLHTSGGPVPKDDCSRLRLDYANLNGADLSNARLVSASLRNANLDNANLEFADLSEADLEGVRLEETSTVVDLAVLDNLGVAAGYDDRSIRIWQRKPGGQWGTQLVGHASHAIERIQVTPRGRLLVFGDNQLSVLSREGSGWICDTRFATNSALRPPAAGPTTILYEEELSGGVTRIAWMELTSLDRYRLEAADETVVCYAQLDGRASAVAHESEVQLALWVEDGARLAARIDLRSVNCMDIRSSPQGGLLLVCGHRNGDITLLQYKLDRVNPCWRSRRHEAMITSVVFVGDDCIVSGGIDGSVKVTMVATGIAPDEEPVMRLTLRCTGVRYDGVQTERERQLLAAAAAGRPR